MTERKRKAPKDDYPRPWEWADRPISVERWRKHRERMMAAAAPGSRPDEWWLYERGREPPSDDEAALLYAMGELRGAELGQLMTWWREAHSAAGRRVHLKWAGIPPEVVKQFDAERKRRSKTIGRGRGMIALTDSQLRTIMQAAALLPVEKRSQFLERVAARLKLRGRFGDRDVVEATQSALRGLVQSVA